MTKKIYICDCCKNECRCYNEILVASKERYGWGHESIHICDKCIKELKKSSTFKNLAKTLIKYSTKH